MLKETAYGEVVRFDLARTILGRGRYWTTAYLVGTTMVDTGCAHAAAELAAALGPRRVERILTTHSHEDHIGGNAVLKRRNPALEVVAHPAALPVLADPRRAQPLHPYRKLMWGWPAPCPARAAADHEVVEADGFRFELLFTPGHATDHLCVLETRRGWVFTGDLFVGGQDRGLRQGTDIWGVIRSLEAVAARRPAALFPGAARVPDDPLAALAAKVAYYRKLGEQVLDLDRRGWSERAIVRALCGGAMPIEALTLGHFARRHLVQSFLRRGGRPGESTTEVRE